MAQKTVPVNVTPETKTRLQKALREHFLPGSAEWAFASGLMDAALDLWERGELEVGKSRPRAPKRNRPAGGSSASRSAPEPALAGVGANSHSNGSEAHSD